MSMNVRQFFANLKTQNLSELERTTTVSRQALYGALKTRNMKLQNLESVAKSLNYEVSFEPVKTEANVLASLARFGVPVAYEAGGSLSLEQAVAFGLELSREDGLFESVLPYALAVNAEKLNVPLLVGAAFELNQAKVLGYFAAMANHFRPHENLMELLRLLSPLKSSNRELLVRKNKVNFPELFEKNELALEWGLLVRGTAKYHLERWNKWAQSRKTT